MEQQHVLGVIGGMGPQAGLSLVKKIMQQTDARGDAAHLPVVLLSYPGVIPPRSAFLLGETSDNPAEALARLVLQLDGQGVTVATLASIEAQAPGIRDPINERLEAEGCTVRLLDVFAETIRYLREEQPDVRRVGILSTVAIYRLGLFRSALEGGGYKAVVPDGNVQENIVDRTIFDPAYGIKAQPEPVSLIARQSLLNAIEHLKEKGADAVILGCTELPLAVPEAEIDALPIADPVVALARALIRETYPDRLRP